MRRRGCWTSVARAALGLAVALAARAAHAGPDALVGAASSPPAIVGDSSALLPAAIATPVVSLPLALPATAAADQVTLELLSVRYDGSLSDTLKPLFVVTPKLATTAGDWPMLTIRIDQAQTLRAGRYLLTLGARNGDGSRLAPFTVTLERPAAQMEPLGRVAIDLVKPGPWRFGAATLVYPAELRIFQTAESKFARIDTVMLKEGPFRGAPEALPGGALHARATTPVAAGEPLVIALQPEGFPVGLSTGKLEMRSPDLKAMQSIDVDVRTRLCAVWLPLTVGLGLVLGFGLRIGLQSRLELAQVRATSAESLRKIAEQLDRIRDAQLHASLKQPMSDLRQAIEEGDKDDAEAARRAAETALTSASADFDARCRDTRARLQKLRLTLAVQGPWPSVVDALLRGAMALVDAAAVQLESLDETSASKTLQGAEQQLQTGLQSALAGWRVAALSEQTVLEVIGAELFDNANRAQLSTLLEHWKQVRDGVSADPSAAQGNLLQLRQSGLDRAALLEWVAGAIEADARDFDTLARSRCNPGKLPSAELAASAAAAAAVAGDLRAAAASEDASGGASHELVRQATRARADLIDRIAPAPGRPAGSGTAYAAGHYFEALRQLPSYDPALGVQDDVNASAAGEPEHVTPTVAEPGEVPSPQPPDLSLAALKSLTVRSAADLARAERLQAFAVAAIVLVVTWLIYNETFVGTSSELLGLLFFGMSFDLSVSKLLEFAGQWAVKPKP